MIRREPLAPEAVYHLDRFVGFVTPRHNGYDATTAGGTRLGLFNTQSAAIAALAVRMFPCRECEG
jgi:hypothetical protein